MHEYISSQTKICNMGELDKELQELFKKKFNASITGGKSSVLTALIVGLGGKATATNRGSSLKMFVRDGET